MVHLATAFLAIMTMSYGQAEASTPPQPKSIAALLDSK